MLMGLRGGFFVAPELTEKAKQGASIDRAEFATYYISVAAGRYHITSHRKQA
jgi:hypothetical protein